MPKLRNKQHEAFAQYLAKGDGILEAFKKAGYKPIEANASRLNQNLHVINRVADLKARANSGTLSDVQEPVTVEWVIDTLASIVRRCLDQHKVDSAGANKALQLIGMHLGMFIERKEVGRPGEFDGLTIAGKRQKVMSMAQQLGLSKLDAKQTAALLTPITPVTIEHEVEPAD